MDAPFSRDEGWRGVFFSRLAAIGLSAGLLNGLLSIGGGIVIVPGLIFLRRVSARVAVSTSLGAVLLMSIVALAAHVTISGFQMSVGGSVLLIVAGMAGAQVGGYFLTRMPQRWIFYSFAALTLTSATHLIMVALDLAPPLSAAAPPIWSYPLIGAISGVASGLLGVGGGGLAVLGFSVGFHTPVLGGLPVALAVNVANSLSGVLAQWRAGTILWRDVFCMLPTNLAGVAAGVGLAVYLSPDALRTIFALFFLFIGARMLHRGWKE